MIFTTVIFYFVRKLSNACCLSNKGKSREENYLLYINTKRTTIPLVECVKPLWFACMLI